MEHESDMTMVRATYHRPEFRPTGPLVKVVISVHYEERFYELTEDQYKLLLELQRVKALDETVTIAERTDPTWVRI